MKEKRGHGHMIYRAGSPNPSGVWTCGQFPPPHITGPAEART